VTIILITGAFVILFFVLAPLGLLLLYRGNPVLETCDRKSGSGGWTRHLNTSQLACILICLLLFLNTLLLPVFMPVVMFWDQVITGTPAILTLLVCAGIFGYATWGLYYQVSTAWWVGMIGLVIITLNYGIVLYLGDLREFYRALNFPAEQIDLVEQSGMIEMMRHMWIGLFFYLFVVLAFFWKARTDSSAAA